MPQPDCERPNVLLISTDHWPASALGVASHPVVKTPTIDQIAHNGTRFTNCYAECPVCVPARRTLMTGLTPRTHGMRQNDSMPMPAVTTMPQAFRDQGYQAFAVGKLHVTPQRDRIGFDEVILEEEGRVMEGVMQDDYELFLADHGHAGQRFAGGMGNNEYVWRPWHLDERLHVTNWAAQQMARTIKRRDPRKPGFYYLSFCHPHPPLNPLRDYLDMYRDVEVPDPFIGDWARGDDATPAWVKRFQSNKMPWKPDEIRAIRKAWYALCTHIDHQIRVVLGTLREERLINNTIIVFTADHGELLGNHGMWAKSPMYEDSTNIPMIISGTHRQTAEGPVHHHRTDDRLMGWADVMPTLLDLCGLPIPGHCEGMSAFGENRREYLWSECYYQAPQANRMIRSGDHKLIYYPAGNICQLFDLVNDPCELHDVYTDGDHATERKRLTGYLIDELAKHEVDAQWVRDGDLVGAETVCFDGPRAHPSFHGQRGLHLPPPHPGMVGW